MTPVENDSMLARLKEVFTWDRAGAAARLSDWFFTYHVDLYLHGVPFEVYVRKARAIRDALGPATRVLDVGAGFGVYACLLRALGVPKVVALDFHREKAMVGRRLAEYLGLDGIEFLQGDALSFPFMKGSFDGALALACLSHIREPAGALANLSRLLKPGSRVYVFEDNNSSRPGYRKSMSRIWEGAETGSYGADIPSDKRIARSYLEIRLRLIRDRFPDLPVAVLNDYARATRGLYGSKIFAAVEALRRGERVPCDPQGPVCDPVSGEFEEYPLNPRLVKEMLCAAGFQPRLRSPHEGPFRGRFAGVKAGIAFLYRHCPRLLTWTSPTFSVVGTIP